MGCSAEYRPGVYVVQSLVISPEQRHQEARLVEALQAAQRQVVATLPRPFDEVVGAEQVILGEDKRHSQ
jgi:hypothetical protein